MEIIGKEYMTKAFTLAGITVGAESTSTEYYEDLPNDEFRIYGYRQALDFLHSKENPEIEATLNEGVKYTSMQEKNEILQGVLVQSVSETMNNGTNFKAWLDTVSRFPKYSVNNSILVYLQKPEASLVCGYKQWEKDFERHVNKGEKGITIMAPSPYKKKILVQEADSEGHLLFNEDGSKKLIEVEKQMLGFKPVKVFDVSQTSGKEMPTICKNLIADVEDFMNIKEAIKTVSPVPVRFVESSELNGAKGCYIPMGKIIKIDRDLPEAQTIKTMVHEVAHAKLKHGEKDCPYTKEERELQAESIAYIVCAHLGVDASEYSFEYLASWSRKDPGLLKEIMTDIQSVASETVQEIEKFRTRELNESYEEMWDKRADKPMIAIYQLPNESDFTFMNYSQMQSEGYEPNIADYELKYVSEDKKDAHPEDVYILFNQDDRPEAETMRSLSVSDVIVKHTSTEDTAYIVDTVGFKVIDNFTEPRAIGRTR